MSTSSHVAESNQGITNEVIAIRVLLHTKEYFANPLHPREHRSINGEEKMSHRLASFTKLARDNFNLYIRKHLLGEMELEINPILATETEEIEQAKLENKTMKEIERLSFNILRLMNEDDQQQLHDHFRRHVKNKTKAKFIDFHDLVMDTFNSKYTYDEGEIGIAENIEVL